jgi:16S rRNA (adenine1518-N6/adenine1519-N6)-dimethyltransferase
MNNVPRLHVAQLLRQYGLHATKSLGQNFLEDPDALQAIADAAEIQKSDVVLEVGPGLGSLTRYLAVLAREVVAVELDRRFTPALRSVLRLYQNTRLIEGDILTLSPEALGLPDGYIVAANIPYNITSALLKHLLTSEVMPTRMVLTVQKEVAARICSKPPDMSILSLSVQVYGEPSIVARIPAEAFYPAPSVDSAVVRIDIHGEPRVARELLPVFFNLIRAGFSQKRKMLRNALSGGLRISPAEAGSVCSEAGIDPQRRAETLALPEWDNLSHVWAAKRAKSRS